MCHGRGDVGNGMKMKVLKREMSEERSKEEGFGERI